MKLAEHNFGFEGNLPAERIAFKIKSSAKLFNILSSGIYEDKILAVIRELSCNAYDAHIAAGKREVPFTIKLPNYLDPTFSITDEGTGIDPAKIGDIFWTYGESTKADSNEYIGALGLGSKSPFAYTKSSFTVRNRFEGKEYVYMCFINEQGTPDGSHLATLDTVDKNGITIEFAVRQNDINMFAERCGKFFATWEATLPNFEGCASFRIPSYIKVQEGRTWYLHERGTNKNAVALMGNVPYTINSESIPNIPASLELLCCNPFVIKFPMGGINFAPSREGLEYDERTCAELLTALELVRKEIVENFHQKIYAAKTHIEFFNKFAEHFRIFKQTFYFSAGSDDNYLQLLFGKSPSDAITFDGENYTLHDLKLGLFKREVPGMTSFGLYSVMTLGNNLKLSPLSRVSLVDLQNYNVKATYESFSTRTGIKTESGIDQVGHTGNETSYTWTPIKTKKTRSSMTALMMAHLSYALVNKSHVEMTTSTQFCVIGGSKVVMIIINDLGAVGQHRAAAYIKANSTKGIQFLFAHNPELKDQFDGIVKDAKGWAGSAKYGIGVSLISELEDLREKVEVENNAKELVKLPVAWFGMVEDDRSYSKKPSPPKFGHISGFNTHVDLTRKTSLKFSDLIAMPRVFYTIRNRSKEVLELHGQKFVLSDWEKIDFIRKEKLDVVLLAGAEKFMVINLTESEVTWMTKKGVKLASVIDVLSLATAAVAAKEQLYEKYFEYKALFAESDFGHFYSVYGRMSSYIKSINDQSPLHTLFTVMADREAKKSKFETISERVKLLSAFTPTPVSNVNAKDYNFKSINTRYPLLETILRCGSLNMRVADYTLMVKYVNDCDVTAGNFSGDEISEIFKSNVF